MTSYPISAVEPSKPTALFRQVKEGLVRLMSEGHTCLPSERVCMRQFEVSRITVRRAVEELMVEGRVYSVPGRGFFASRTSPEFELDGLGSFTDVARRAGRNPATRSSEYEMQPATDEVANLLAIPPGASVHALRRVRLLDGLAVVVQVDLVPLSRCPDALEVVGFASLFAILRDRYGLRPAQSRTIVSARLATPEEAPELELNVCDPVLVVRQVTLDPSGSPYCLTYSAQHPQRMPLSISHVAHA